MRSRALALFAGILALGLMPGPALAANIVDQSNLVTDSVCLAGNAVAQTVTVGQTGKLTGVNLYLYGASGGPIALSIQGLDRGSGYPSGSTLATSDPVSVIGLHWFHFNFPTPYSFLAGGRFAIVFSIAVPNCAYGSGGQYASGNALVYGSTWTTLKGDANLDFAFATEVDTTPAPTASPTPTATASPTPTATSVATKAPTPTATKAPTAAPTNKPTATATTKPVATATPTAVASTASAAATDPDPSVSTATDPAASDSTSVGATAAQTDAPSGGSGVPPIAIFGIVALAVALGGGIGWVLARRPSPVPPGA